MAKLQVKVPDFIVADHRILKHDVHPNDPCVEPRQVWLVSFIIPVLLLGVFIDAVHLGFFIDLDVVITRFTVARPIASFVVFFEEMPLVGSCVVLPVPVVHDTGRTPVVMVTGPVAGTKSPSLLALFAALRTGAAEALKAACMAGGAAGEQSASSLVSLLSLQEVPGLLGQLTQLEVPGDLGVEF
ncbi:hypothetical protein AK812_SmicGene4025 [Symbiodinium microadriaticum]|uniref:Uncharacterized protein n=1 Tax=Symbiodinium microadriaticum TaxID=2951 RepID=A0A1Q9EX85_SYMMI|nr:hypothetical protein AK812_SmicGene4025 [Symbiodinium microadriaticum]